MSKNKQKKTGTTSKVLWIVALIAIAFLANIAYKAYQDFVPLRENTVQVFGKVNSTKIEYRTTSKNRRKQYIVANFEYQIDSVTYLSPYFYADDIIYSSNTLRDLHTGNITEDYLLLQPLFVNPKTPEFPLTWNPAGKSFLYYLYRIEFHITVLLTCIFPALLFAVWLSSKRRLKNNNGFALANKIVAEDVATTKTTYNKYVLIIALLLFIIIDANIIRIFLKDFYNNPFANIYEYYSIAFVMVIFTIIIILYPPLTTYTAEIINDKLIFKWKFLPKTKVFDMNTIDGYYMTKIETKKTLRYRYYLTSNEHLLPPIISLYYTNSKRFITTSKLKFLGEIPFSLKFHFLNVLLLKKIPRNYISNLQQKSIKQQ